jgi:hypothetical protein
MFAIYFTYNNKSVDIKSKNGVLQLYIKVLSWLDDNDYNFSGEIHNNFVKGVFTEKELENLLNTRKYLKKNMFHDINKKGKYIQISEGNISTRLRYIIEMLTNFGIDPSTIKTEGFDIKPSRIKKFNEIEEEDSETEQEPIEPSKPSINPFNQAILILGESGAGKSYTIENILESSNHNYQFIIPTAATTGLLAQFSPSKSTYVPSRLGRMLIEASNNPDKLYTAVFDECHKSNVIEMINDELLQAISLKRNRYRFISLDDDTAEVFEDSNLEVKRGNIKIPDNFGFIFISSNPRVIGGNPDFFNRVDLIELTEADRSINNIERLLSKKVEESNDKRELIDKLRSK